VRNTMPIIPYNPNSMSRFILFTLTLALACCSSQKDQPAQAPGAARAQAVVPTAENKNHPLAKYIEVAGFRLSEKPGGKAGVRFVVINHSQADVTDLGLAVTTPPCTVNVKVPTIAPEESKDVNGECATTLRIYELPDWQFIKPVFRITSPVE
jgi:hypothetical protein